MRPIDWVDRLAGVDSLDPCRFGRDDEQLLLHPVGGWTRWPWWARLADLLWVWVRTPVACLGVAAWYVLCHGRNVRKWGQRADGCYYPTLGELWDITIAIHSIDLRWSTGPAA